MPTVKSIFDKDQHLPKKRLREEQRTQRTDVVDVNKANKTWESIDSILDSSTTRQNIRQLKSYLAAIRADFSALVTNESHLRVKIETLSGRFQSGQASYVKITTQLSDASKQLEDLQRNYDMVKSRNDNLTRQLQEATTEAGVKELVTSNQLQDMTTQCEDMRRSLDMLQGQLRDMEQAKNTQISHLQYALQTKEDLLNNCSAGISKYQQVIRDPEAFLSKYNAPCEQVLDQISLQEDSVRSYINSNTKLVRRVLSDIPGRADV